jgi:hypothetical protein
MNPSTFRASLWSRLAVGLVPLGVALTSAPPAHADPGLPQFIEQHLQMPCLPQCTICHKDNQGGFGTLRPGKFGANMEMYFGLNPTDHGTWASALDQSEKAGFDTDKDGMPDIQELRKGDDPNDPSPGASVCSDENLKYGCLHVAPQPRADGFAAACGAAALVVGIGAMRRGMRRRGARRAR